MTVQQKVLLTEHGTPVRVSGRGPTVILVHGVLMDHRMWFRQVEALSPHYRVCCMDMLGHGDAPDPPGERALDDFVTQLSEVVQRFSDAGRPVLGGFSMGGLVAQAYAARHHDRLSGLILLSTVHDRTPEESAAVRARFERNVSCGVENAVASGASRWFTQQDHATHAETIKAIQGWMRDGNFAAKRKAHGVFVTSDSAVSGKLGAISCPALIMTGEQDGGSTSAMSHKMAAAMPNAELHVLEGQHHMLPLLDAPRVNRLLLDFLSRCTQT